jgi:N-ethylmaleimide reductase
VTKSTLFEPTKLGSWKLANRIAMAPMSRFRADPKTFVPAEYAAEYYGQRNTCGMLITEATQMSADAVGYPRSPGLYSAQQTARWKKIVAAIHKGPAKAVVQLWHTGRISHPYNRPGRDIQMAPSPVKPNMQIYSDAHGMVDFLVPREMTEEDIQDVIDNFGKTAANAKKAGFDGIEIHGANGYLLDQFAASNTNKRTDKWGGSYKNRMRITQEIIKSISKVYKKSEIGIRYSPYGTFDDIHEDDPLALFKAQVEAAAESGIGYVHVIRPEVTGDLDVEKPFEHADVVGIARKMFPGVIIAAGQYTRETAEKELGEGRADIIAFGRPFVSNPDLVQRLKNGTPLTPLIRDLLYVPGQKGYIDYPSA